MRRYILLLLLAVLTIQTTWAAVAYCPRGAHQGDRAATDHHATDPEDGQQHGTTAHSHHEHPSGEHAAAGHPGGASSDCGLFQFVAVVPLNVATHPDSGPNGAVAGVEFRHYESYVPDGLERPNWCFAV